MKIQALRARASDISSTQKDLQQAFNQTARSKFSKTTTEDLRGKSGHNFWSKRNSIVHASAQPKLQIKIENIDVDQKMEPRDLINPSTRQMLRNNHGNFVRNQMSFQMQELDKSLASPRKSPHSIESSCPTKSLILGSQRRTSEHLKSLAINKLNQVVTLDPAKTHGTWI